MDILISRILKYLNGCLDNDHLYKIGTFFVKYYTQMKCFDLNDVMEKGQFSYDDICDFCQHFGYRNFDEFKDRLLIDQQMRLDEITLRMNQISVDKFLNHLEISTSKEEFMELIDELCDLIFKCQRVVIIGSLYPSNVTVDFQTDLISFGKEIIEYHHFDNDFYFNENDIAIFISATGRLLERSAKKMIPQKICDADVVLITQNIKYKTFENVCADYVIHVLGDYDSIQFNYQIMMIFDILRIRYFQKYYSLKDDEE